MCPFSILAFLQPTTVDKEPLFLTIIILIQDKCKKKQERTLLFYISCIRIIPTHRLRLRCNRQQLCLLKGHLNRLHGTIYQKLQTIG